MTEHTIFEIRCRAVIVRDGKLLVVRHPHAVDFYVLPGGHLEWGEDVLSCIAREVEEELGVAPEIGKLLYVHTLIVGNKQSTEFFFEVTNGEDFADLSSISGTHAHEIAEVIWMDPHDSFTILPVSFGQDFKEGKLFDNPPKFIPKFIRE